MPNWPYKRAIITGATSGLGEEYALQLAPHLKEAIIIGRREDRLTLVKESMLKKKTTLDITCLPLDLTNGEQLHTLISHALSLPPCPTLLINNAGLGDYGDFQTADWQRIEAMLLLNIATLTKLCHAMIPMLVDHGGGIINISSLASSLPIPDFAVYAATKSYVLSFSEAIRLELKQSKVNVLAVCPGPVATEFGKVARRPGFTGNMMPGRNFFDTQKEKVVLESLREMLKNKARTYPGDVTKLAALLLSVIPTPFLRLAMGRRPRKTQPLPPNTHD